MNYNPNYIDLDWLKRNYQMIHYFGLGFIQLKLNDRERLHFYTDKIGKTVEEEELHNHRYNFVSTVIRGSFMQQIYEIDFQSNCSPYILTQETCKSDDKREFPKTECNISHVFTGQYFTKDSYYINHNTFHKVISTNAITHVKRSEYKKEFADVVYKKGKSIVCPFSVKMTDEELFDIIHDILHYL
jgi:hypothetical protein